MKTYLVLMSLGIFGAVITMALAPAGAADKITCASTTSTQNSGLFDVLLPAFKKATGIDVAVVAVGTGQAIEMARRGDADVLFVHDPDKEATFVADGFGVARKPVMYNDFIIVGPAADMAKIKGMKDATEAFKKMAAAGVHFVSRGDKSGTHAMEQKIWKKAGVDPTGKPAYLEAGQGMESTLRMASEKQFYTLTDRGTWLAVKDKDKLAQRNYGGRRPGPVQSIRRHCGQPGQTRPRQGERGHRLCRLADLPRRPESHRRFQRQKRQPALYSQCHRRVNRALSPAWQKFSSCPSHLGHGMSLFAICANHYFPINGNHLPRPDTKPLASLQR